MMESLTFIARYLDDTEQRRDLLLKTLQLFIQQGITAKRAIDTAQSSHKVGCVSSGLSNWTQREREPWLLRFPYVVRQISDYSRCLIRCSN